MSTSSLSQSVRQLEARLGVTLLARTSRSVALTDAGQRLLVDAGPAIDQALQSLKTVTARPGEVSGRVGITVPHAAVPLIHEQLLPRFVERYPRSKSRSVPMLAVKYAPLGSRGVTTRNVARAAPVRTKVRALEPRAHPCSCRRRPRHRARPWVYLRRSQSFG